MPPIRTGVGLSFMFLLYTFYKVQNVSIIFRLARTIIIIVFMLLLCEQLGVN